jgi:uncharacterized SAM-binding protein YcdF (DUF218 family)
VVISLLIACAAVGLLTARLFVWPSTASLTSADAVVVLAGDHGDRLAKGLALMQAGAAPVLVLDGQPDMAAVATLCAGNQPFEVVCLRPSPDSTRAEAQEAGRLAADRAWRRIAVVTTRSHVTRADLLFRRCTGSAVVMVGTDPPYGLAVKIQAVRHEWLGYADALLRHRSC